MINSIKYFEEKCISNFEKNPYYFCSVSIGEGNKKFWDKIYKYLDSHYDLKQVRKDSREDVADELRTAIQGRTKKDFEELVDKLEDYQEGETGRKRMEEARKYILSNWTAAKIRHGELGKYVESISHSMSIQNKKVVYFNSHIWGL